MSELKARTARSIADEEEMLELGAPDGIEPELVYIKSEVDKVIADLEESHKKEVEQLQMKIAGLEKLVETANKLLKPAYEDKGGFTVKDVTFKGIKLEGMASEPEV